MGYLLSLVIGVTIVGLIARVTSAREMWGFIRCITICIGAVSLVALIVFAPIHMGWLGFIFCMIALSTLFPGRPS